MATPVIAAAFLATSTAHANEPPQVVINGLVSGQLVFNGPVQVTGVTADAQGIARIFGTIQDRKTGLFYDPSGKFGKNPVQLPFQFRQKTARTNWTTTQLSIPPGNYIYRMLAEDGQKVRSESMEVAMIVRSGNSAGAATSAAETTQQLSKQVAKQPAAKPAGAMAANGMPYCGNPGMDTDKDGYGWENEKSCVVAGSNADKHPNCATATSDPDGDGWGWENERSCVVVTHCQSAGSDPDGDGWGWENDKSCVVVKTSGKHPQCASANSDPDGDGYGWENNATCLVAK